MKKCSLLVLLLSLLVLSCSKTDEYVSDQKGTLKVSSTVNDDIKIVTSRAGADVGDFTLTLQDEKTGSIPINGIFSKFPDGIVEDIPASSYKLTLTSHPDGFKPAFEEPWYEGIRAGVPIKGGQTTDVALECVQANTGIYFTYDSSLEQFGVTDIVPLVTQNDDSLAFEGANRESKGYFLPESAELKIKYGDSYLPISGQEIQVLDFAKEQLWQINLKAKQTGGSLAISATVKVITDPTNIKDFELGNNQPVADLLNVEIIELKAFNVTFLVKGIDINSVKHALFTKASVDKVLATGTTLEELMEQRGSELEDLYLSALNNETGLRMNYTGLTPETEFSFVLMATKGKTVKVQRLDFASPEDKTGVPHPNPDPNGPIMLGSYSINLFQDQDETTGEYIDPYENVIEVIQAKQENLYIISNLFEVTGIDLVAVYDDTLKKLTFRGDDVNGEEVINQIAISINGGQYAAGIFVRKEGEPMTPLVVYIKDRKLISSPLMMELDMFDPFDLNYLGWIEISPENNPYTYMDVKGRKSAAKPYGFNTRLGNKMGTGKSLGIKSKSSNSDLTSTVSDLCW